MPFIAFYGTLMQSFAQQAKVNLQNQLQYKGPCEIVGKLYDLGDYPGLVYGQGLVKAELYQILDPRVISKLDQYECYTPNQPRTALYIRSCVRLASPNVDAWVYFYNQTPPKDTHIKSGDWQQFKSNNANTDLDQ